MPDLRLTDQEAADITAYLLTLRNQDFEAQAVPPLDRNARDELILEYLQSRLSEAAAKDRLAAMSELEGDLYLGQKIILRQGCFGCHLIPGFEQMQPIGTELTAEGEKDVGRLDFGLNPLGIPHSRQAWFYTKLQQPRVFDLLHLEGGPDRVRVKEYDEKLRMPDFRLTDEDAHAVTTALLSFRKSTVTQEAVRHLTPHEQDIERGRELMHQHNCQGCHVVEGGGGAIRETLTSVYVDERAISPAEASGFVPPTLDGEGEKVQPDWLFGFLRNPDVIRPWLEVRMPSFGFDDQDAIDITTYFSRLDRQKFPYHTFVDKHLSRNNIRGAELLFSGEVYDCWTCHQQGDIPPKGDPASWAPDLKLARERLRPGWTARWLWDPQQVQPGTKMPTFFGEEMTYLPEALAEDLDLPEGTSPEDGVLILPARQVVEALNDYMVYGLHQSRPLTKK